MPVALHFRFELAMLDLSIFWRVARHFRFDLLIFGPIANHFRVELRIFCRRSSSFSLRAYEF